MIVLLNFLEKFNKKMKKNILLYNRMSKDTKNNDERKTKNLSDLSTNDIILLIVGTFIMSILIYFISISKQGERLYYIKALFLAAYETEEEDIYPDDDIV